MMKIVYLDHIYYQYYSHKYKIGMKIDHWVRQEEINSLSQKTCFHKTNLDAIREGFTIGIIVENHRIIEILNENNLDRLEKLILLI